MSIARGIGIMIALFTCAVTVLAFVRTDLWWVRIFDFPRVQIVVFGLIGLILLMIFRRKGSRAYGILAAALAIAIVVQSWFIFPYTFVAAQQVKAAEDGSSFIGVMVANVLQENRDSDELMRQIARVDPDVILLTETDQWWTDEMRVLERTHPHTISHPLPNTYGMNLYSRLPLIGGEVRFLIDPEIPSIRTHIDLDGRRVLFHGLHPTPPGVEHPSKDELQDSDQRDAELIVIAKEVEHDTIPLIIAGDFNDVAWSHTSRLFQRISGTLDPRIGRGFFNTYHAELPLFRYPLDHLYHSDHFSLITIKRLDRIGSDHFPIYVALSLEPGAVVEQEAPEKKNGDEEEAQEIMEREAEADRPK